MKPYQKHGCRIVDASNPLHVRVTAHDIEKAICRDHQKCAIARALKRQTHAQWVDVGASTVLIQTGKKTAKRYLLPSFAREQVRFFDTHRGAMAPADILLAVQPRREKLGVRPRPGSDKSRKSNKARRKPTR